MALTIFESNPASWGHFVWGDDTVFADLRIDFYTWVVTLPKPHTGVEAIIIANCQPDRQVAFVYIDSEGFGSYDFSDTMFGS